LEIRRLIREMSLANRLWGALRIHGELLKLGIEVAQSTAAKYTASSGEDGRRPGRPFLRTMRQASAWRIGSPVSSQMRSLGMKHLTT